MSFGRPPRPPASLTNPYTSPQHLKRPSSNAPPPSAQPLPSESQDKGTPRPGKPAEPARQHFDPWNSSSTGHQRAENNLAGSTSWRQSRNAKLTAQFGGGAGGGTRLSDTVGAGSADFGRDGRKANGGWERGAPGLRDRKQPAIWEAMGRSTKRRKVDETDHGPHGQGMCSKETNPERLTSDVQTGAEVGQTGANTGVQESSIHVEIADETCLTSEKQLFRGLCFFINGSTAPTISDHKFKRLLASHGASTSIMLGRGSVTHVILGSAGGGLAGGKLQREIARVGGKGIKYVGVEWVVESVRAGKRLPEAGFSNLHVAPAGQRSVYGMFKKGGGSSSNSSRTRGDVTK